MSDEIILYTSPEDGLQTAVNMDDLIVKLEE
jgi:hypothetical protein